MCGDQVAPHGCLHVVDDSMRKFVGVCVSVCVCVWHRKAEDARVGLDAMRVCYIYIHMHRRAEVARVGLDAIFPIFLL